MWNIFDYSLNKNRFDEYAYRFRRRHDFRKQRTPERVIETKFPFLLPEQFFRIIT